MQTGSCGTSRSYYIVISLIMLITVSNFIHKELFLSSTSSLGPSLLCSSSMATRASTTSSQHVPKNRSIQQPPSDGLSPATFLINFKLDSEEGVCSNFQKNPSHAMSWLTKQREQSTQKSDVDVASTAATAAVSCMAVVESWFSSRFFILLLKRK